MSGITLPSCKVPPCVSRPPFSPYTENALKRPSTGTVPNPIGNEKKLVLKKIIMEPCPVVPGTEELGITGGWTPVVQIFTLAGCSSLLPLLMWIIMVFIWCYSNQTPCHPRQISGPSPEECLYSSNNSLAFSYNTRDHPQCVMNIGGSSFSLFFLFLIDSTGDLSAFLLCRTEWLRRER